MEYMLTFHILNMYVDKTQPHQFKFTFKTNVEVVHKDTVGACIKVKFGFLIGSIDAFAVKKQ